MEDFALRFTARRARRWGYGRVANTALGSISFLALEAIGGAITLTWGFNAAIVAIMVAGLILFLTGLPVSYYAARYGVDIDLLTRGAGFGYIGSTITSLIYASFTFIFFALEAAILAYAIEFCFGIPTSIGYMVSALIIIPLVMNGFSKISTFQAWTQPVWILLHILPFALLISAGVEFDIWSSFVGERGVDGTNALMIGAAMGVVLSLIAQIGEQVDFLRFLPEPKSTADRLRWWAALLAAGPGWTLIGVAKMLAGSFLLVLALSVALPPQVAADPTQMYFAAFEHVVSNPTLALVLTGSFVILSQLKINVTNAYAGSIAWSNFFSRLTHSHPGRVVWLVFNVAISVMLMEVGVFHAIESILGLYSHVALAWIGALTADLVINKPLGLSPKGVEFRRAYLYDINPVGTGAMVASVIFASLALLGVFGETGQHFSALIALATAMVCAPIIAWRTRGRYYLARPVDAAPLGEPGHTRECCVCEYRFDAEDMADCPFYDGPICSLCCTLDASCRDSCKPVARLSVQLESALRSLLPSRIVDLLKTRVAVFFLFSALLASFSVAVLLVIRSSAASAVQLNLVLTVIFCCVLVVGGVVIWTLILSGESQQKARADADMQTQHLLQEVRAHERTDAALQAAKDKAEAANLAKTRYMAGISHELRTPLNAIYGYAQLLEQDSDTLSSQRHAVTAIRRGSEHLAGLIENLLDISKIEAGRLELHRERINLPALLRQITDTFERQIQDKGLEFGIEQTDNLPEWVDFDGSRLRQILINLLSNAIAYTPEGSVQLRISYRNEVAHIAVIDSGIGIATDELSRIWNPFERFAPKSTSGSGLGLTITRLLVEILGGEITVDSVLGSGTTFTVRLMLPVARGYGLPHVEQAGSKPISSVGYHGPRKSVMVVDDDMDNLGLLAAVLGRHGFQVHSASDGDAALAVLDDVQPDLFVLDVDMPIMNGWDLARALRTSSVHSATPILMVSGHALETRMPHDQPPCYDAFIVKPYSINDFLVRAAMLMRVELVPSRSPVVESESDRADIPDDVIRRMIELAEIGHVAGVQGQLDALEATHVIGRESLSSIRKRLEEFDLQAVAELLKARLKHVR